MIGQTIRLTGAMNRARAHHLIEQAPQGAVLNIRPATRTNEQNNKMHAMLSDVARAKPDGREMTTDQWKAAFMDAAGFKPTFIPSLDGESFLCLGYKSSRLTKMEFSDLIECIYEFGARKGIEWSEPQPKKDAA
jgi:hypothetical protein